MTQIAGNDMNLLDFCNNCDRLKSFVNKDISRKKQYWARCEKARKDF